MAKFKVGDHVVGGDFHWNEEMSTKGKIKGKNFVITGASERGDLVEISPPLDPSYPTELFDERRFELTKIQPAKKEFTGKTPFRILFQIPALRAVADVFGYGMSKYSEFNWRDGVNQAGYKMKLMDAALRHCFSYMTGDKLDPESGKSHLAHAVCNLLMVADLDDLESK